MAKKIKEIFLIKPTYTAKAVKKIIYGLINNIKEYDEVIVHIQ